MASIGSVSVSVVPSAEGFTDKLRATLLPEMDVLGDEAGDRLREHIQSKLDEVKIKVGVDSALADAELDKVKAKADELPNKKNIDVSVNNSGGVMGWLVSLVAGAVAIAPAFAVAGVGVAAFTALAIPSITKVTTYEKDLQTNSTKTAAAWAALNTQQKDMAVGLHNLGTQFSTLQQQAGPDVLRVFNAGLSQVANILPELVPLAHAASFALAGILTQIGTALSDSQAQQFFAFVEKNIGPDMQQIGNTVVSLLHLFFNLVEGMQPVSLALLHIVSGLADFLAILTKVAPWLTDITVLFIALYKPVSALLALDMFGWASKAATGVADFMAATEGATAAERAMFLAELALEAISPWVWAGLAVAGLVALIAVTRQNSDETQTWIGSMQRADQATGFNIAGYQKLTNQLGQALRAQDAINHSTVANRAVGQQLGDSLNMQTTRMGELTAAQHQAIITGTNLSVNLGIIKSAFNLTSVQAEQLATKAGVSAKALGSSGNAGATATGKVLAFGKATDSATGSTNSMTLAVTGLTNSINLLITPLLTAEGAQVSWKQAQQSATAAIKANTGSLDSNKASALTARQAIIGATNAALSNAEAQVKLHGNMDSANRIIQDQINWLEKNAGKSKIAKDEIHALREEEAQLRNIHQNIDVTGKGEWSTTGVLGAGAPGGIGHHVGAKGLYVRDGTGPTADDVIARVSRGELVVPTNMVEAGEVDHLKGRIPGFASGGVVGSHQGLRGMPAWLRAEDQATLHAIDQAVAQSFASSVQSMLSAGIGLGGVSNASAVAALQSAAAKKGWTGPQWNALVSVEMREAGFNIHAQNPSSGAYGMAQFINGPSEYYQYGGNPNTAAGQAVGMVNYIGQRYGTPEAAWAHEQAFNWYDNGGWMPAGGIGVNMSGKPEPVFSNAQWQILSKAVQGGDGASMTRPVEAKLDQLIAAVGKSAVKTGHAVGEALNETSGRVANRSRYQVGE